MDKQRKELSDIEKIEYSKNEMKNIINKAKISIQEEFFRSPNNRTACFKSIIFQLEMNLSIIRKYEEIENSDKIESKIESLKGEADRLSNIYPEKNTEPSNKEKDKLFD
ncbi:MAG: hypothetical protein WCL02_04025 [bacterium]